MQSSTWPVVHPTSAATRFRAAPSNSARSRFSSGHMALPHGRGVEQFALHCGYGGRVTGLVEQQKGVQAARHHGRQGRAADPASAAGSPTR